MLSAETLKEIKGLSLDDLEDLLFSFGDYEEPVPDINEFLDGDKYLGPFFQGTLRPFWRDRMNEIYPNPYYSPYWLVNLSGCIGSGKSTLACAGMAYDLMKLLHMVSPQSSLGVIPTSKIIFSIFNVTLSLTTDVVWDKMSQIFTSSPYFSDLMGPLRTKAKNRDTIFPKRIDFAMGSRVGHSLGKDVFEAILDEANFEIVDGQITKTFNSLLRRMESRFMKRGGGVPGKIWIVSSETEKFASVNNIVESYRGKKGVYISKAPLWDVVPERYGTASFWVYTGSEVRQPELIDNANLHLLKSEPDNCIEVPEEHRDSFTVDVNQALRDLAGIATGSTYRLFRLKDRLTKAACISPLFPDIVVIDFDNDDDQIANYLRYDGYFDHPLSAGMPRFISIDIGVSGDRLGIAAAHIERFQERTVKNLQMEEITEMIPVINVEFAFAIEPTPGKQIPLWKIRTFIDWLSTKNYVIDRVSCDGYMSTDMLQLLQHQGYTATLLSVDKTPAPYFKLRSMVYEGRCALPINKLLSRELEELLVSPKGDKVDHPTDFNSDRSKPSKDVADAVAASVYSATTEGNKNKLLYYQPYVGEANEDFVKGFWPEMVN